METQELDRLAALGERALFAAGGRTYRWSDVIEHAEREGALASVRARTRAGIACARRAEALGDLPDDDTVRGAATRYRYERGLLSAEELEAWLERWSLTFQEWRAYLERSLLLERWAEKLAPIEAEFAADGWDSDAAQYVDAVCSGVLEREANALVAAAALPAEARAEAAAPAAIEREIAARRLDWTRLDVDLLDVADRDTAAEAAFCVRMDGRSFADVAADCGAPLQRTCLYLGDIEAELAAALLAAQAGELVGPVERRAGFAVVAVLARMPAHPGDAELRRRAEALLVERALERAIETHVEWYDRL